MLDYFEVVGFELHEDSISVRLDERDRILKKKSGHTYVKNGFLPESRITDHLAEKKQILRLARCQSISLKMVTVVVSSLSCSCTTILCGKCTTVSGDKEYTSLTSEISL